MIVRDIEYRSVPVDDLLTFEKNPRRGDVARISESLRARGQYRPLVVNRGTHTGRSMEVLAGNHTLLAARSIGLEAVDCGIIDVDEQTARSIVLADNRLADLGGYDDATLLELLDSLDDISGTGYTEADLDALIAAQVVPEQNTDPDDAPDVPDEPPISAPGDVYDLGPHRVICGDATDIHVVDRLLGGERADCVWTDPPYGVNYLGKRVARRAIENDGGDNLDELLAGALACIVAGARPGAPVYMCSPQGPLLHTFQSAFMNAGIDWRQSLVWVKHHFVIGRADYHYKHEPILSGTTPVPVVDDGDEVIEVTDHDPIVYGFAPGGDGRLGRGGEHWFGDNKQTSVFTFPKPPASKSHPTMKPVDLVLAMLRNSCRPGGVVLDVFGGSGSTLIAAHQGGYRARLVELDPRYVDVICRRWQQHTGGVPLRDGKEVSFL